MLVRQFAAMLWKELIQVANRRRLVAGKSFLVLFLSVFFVLLVYDAVYRRNRESIYAQMSQFGRNFFLFTFAFLTIALCIHAMIVASGIVASETVRRRMPLLLVSPLGSGSIVGSKAASVFLQVAVGFAAALPVVALLQMFGGVDTRMILVATAFLISNVWLYASIGLAASVLTSNVLWAVSLAGMAVFLWNLLPLLLWMFLWNVANMRTPAWYIASLSPFYTYVAFATANAGRLELLYHFSINLAIGLAFFAVAFLAFRPLAMRRLGGPPGGSKRRKSPAKSGPRRRSDRSRMAGLARRLEPGIISKELASSRFKRIFLPLFWFAIPWGIVFLVSFSIGEWPDFADKDLGRALFFTEAVGFLFFLSIFASTRVSGEKEASTLQTLALTRLSSFRILAGKGVALLVEQAVPIILLFSHLLVVLHMSAQWHWFLSLMGFACSITLSTAFGLYFSLAAKKTVEAVVATAFAWFVGCYAIVVPTGVLLEIFDMADAEVMLLLSLFVIPCSIVWLLLVLWRGKKRGFGAVTALVSYALLSCAALGVIILWSGERTSVEDYLPMLSPMAAIFPGDWNERGVPAILYALPIQIAAIVWMMSASVANFEQQVRRCA